MTANLKTDFNSAAMTHFFNAVVFAIGLGTVGSVQAVTLALSDHPLFSTAVLADAEGYFKAEGLDLKIIPCVNGQRCLKHLTDGEAQYAVASDTPIMQASLAGAKFEVLATLGTTSRHNRLLARADHGIKGVADLKGKRIGVIIGTTGHYFTDTLLQFYGLAPAQYTLVDLDPADQTGRLLRGELDAIGVNSPSADKAVATLGSKAVLMPDPKIVTFTVNLVGLTIAAGGRDEDAIKLLRALKRAHQLIISKPELARAVVAARLKLAPAALAVIWKDLEFEFSLGQTLITTLEAQARWALRNNLVAGGKMPDYLDYVRIGPLKTVDRRAVTLIK